MACWSWAGCHGYEVHSWADGPDTLHARIARYFRRLALRERVGLSTRSFVTLERNNGWVLACPLSVVRGRAASGAESCLGASDHAPQTCPVSARCGAMIWEARAKVPAEVAEPTAPTTSCSDLMHCVPPRGRGGRPAVLSGAEI